MKKTYIRNRYREVRLLNKNDDATGILPLLVTTHAPKVIFIATIIAIIGIITMSYDLILLGVVILMALTIAMTLKIDKLAATSILLILFALLVIRFFNIS